MLGASFVLWFGFGFFSSLATILVRKRDLFVLKNWIAAVYVLCLCPMMPWVGIQSVITAENHVTSKQQQWQIPLKRIRRFR